MATQKQRNGGIRKLCDCRRRQWAKCSHPWHFNYKPKGGQAYRFSLDVELGRHIDNKTEAINEAENIRIAIRAGTFRRRGEASEAAPAAVDVVTLATLGQTYFDRRGKAASAGEKSYLARLVAFIPAEGARRFGATPITAITEDVVELFFARLRQEGRAASTRNKYVQLVKAMFRWATKKGYLARNPIGETESIRREKHAKRNRRLVADVLNDAGKVETDGEERRLLAVAGPHLQRLVIAALETGMRRGELLGLMWRDVNMERREITVRAETTKTRTARILPMSGRLAGIVEMASTALTTMLDSGPAKDLSEQDRAALVARCHVFGDGVGGKVGNVKRAWETAVLKAHGHTPQWTKTSKALAPASRVALDAIDLHFHDLRHEAGSRLLEAGWPLHHVQEMLGHANVSQTSTYLNATRIGLQESMRRFDDARCNPVANNTTTEHSPDRNVETPTEANSLVN